MLTAVMLRKRRRAALADAGTHLGFFIGGPIDRAYADIGQDGHAGSIHAVLLSTLTLGARTAWRSQPSPQGMTKRQWYKGT